MTIVIKRFAQPLHAHKALIVHGGAVGPSVGQVYPIWYRTEPHVFLLTPAMPETSGTLTRAQLRLFLPCPILVYSDTAAALLVHAQITPSTARGVFFLPYSEIELFE